MAYQVHDFPLQRMEMWPFDNMTGCCGSSLRMHYIKATGIIKYRRKDRDMLGLVIINSKGGVGTHLEQS